MIHGGTARLSSKGQVTIPIGIRRRLGLRAGENAVFIEHQGGVSIRSAWGLGIASPDQWSDAYIEQVKEQVKRFGETPDPTFHEQPELPFSTIGELFE